MPSLSASGCFPLLLEPLGSGRDHILLVGVHREDVTGAQMPSPSFVGRLRDVLSVAGLSPTPAAAGAQPSPGGEPARWFAGAASTVYRPETGLKDRLAVAGDVQRMADLFTGLGYRRVSGLEDDLGRDDLLRRLRGFLTGSERRVDDIVVVYYAGYGVLGEGGLLLPMADTTADVAYTALAAGELTGRLLSAPVVVQRLLFIVDVCHPTAAGRAPVGGAAGFLNRLGGVETKPLVVVVAARPDDQAASGALTRSLAAAIGHRASGGHEPPYLAVDGLGRHRGTGAEVRLADPRPRHGRTPSATAARAGPGQRRLDRTIPIGRAVPVLRDRGRGP
jgi:Caspase domain